LWGVIEELVADGATLLLTTQYLEEADRLADRIAVVDHGRVIADGTAAELKAQLGSTIIHVEVADPSIADAAKTVLAEVGPTDLSDDGRSVEVKVTDSGRSLLAAVRTLDAAGIEPVAVSVREPSLDDVFLTLTGRPADADDDIEEAS
jgi:ABC-2 type transport system ATP-binding protein